MRRSALIVPLLLFTGCKEARHEQAAAAQPTVAVATASAAPAASPAAQARDVTIENRAMSFKYSYPAPAAAIPALKAKLDADIEARLTSTREGAKELAEADRDAEGPPRELVYSHSTEWKVVADLPGWLSMNADRWEFTGGAHGNPWSNALLWDKTANVERTALDLFASRQTFAKAIGTAFCEELYRQRAAKRGGEADLGTLDDFDACIDPGEVTVILGSADREHFTRIGFIIDPYVAGPYAEGFYEVTLPVTAAVISAVKPEFRASFAIGR